MKWFVGTSGWGYPNWKEEFYPEDLPQREWLGYYAKHFDAVEINTTFYHLPRPGQMRAWEKLVPRDFTFVAKGSRYITHMKRLKEPRETLPALMKVVREQKKTIPVIFQLPPHFKKDAARLENFLKALPKPRRYAVEFRDPDWHNEEIYKLIEKYKVCFCLFEKGELRSPRVATADFTYVRLHGRLKNYKGDYKDSELREWRDWLTAQKRDAYVFFDNTAQKICALDNAMSFRDLTAEKSLRQKARG